MNRFKSIVLGSLLATVSVAAISQNAKAASLPQRESLDHQVVAFNEHDRNVELRREERLRAEREYQLREQRLRAQREHQLREQRLRAEREHQLREQRLRAERERQLREQRLRAEREHQLREQRLRAERERYHR